jgi:hypothetical protein
MDFGILFKKAGKVAAENSPAILTALGVSGTITTAYLAAKAAFKSVDVLREAEAEKELKYNEEVASQEEGEASEKSGPEPLTMQEKVEAVAELYIPAVISGALTITAIILAARVQERRNAALASAYCTLKESYTEYRAKNVEKLGKKKEQELRDEIAQDRVNRTPASKSVVFITKKGGETACQDAWSGRFFTSSRNLIDKAVNEFNAQILRDGYASLSEFYHLVGLPATTDSDYIGWRDDKILEIDWSAVIDKDEEPALCFTFKVLPDPRFASAY